MPSARTNKLDPAFTPLVLLLAEVHRRVLTGSAETQLASGIESDSDPSASDSDE